MLVGRVFSRASTTVSRSFLLFSASQSGKLIQLPTLSNQFHSVVQRSPVEVLLFHYPTLHSSFQRFQISSSVTPEEIEKEGDTDSTKVGDEKVSDETENSHSTKESESDDNLSINDLMKVLAEKEELLKQKHQEMEKMQDKFLRSYAEMENVIARTKREAENTKKFAIQNFAKGLLDVADNLGRASSVVKDSFSKIDTSKDSAGALPLLKTLLEGVEMTEKQLGEVLKKFGVEKFDPTNEPFDPHRHNAVFEIPDGSKPSGTVAVILKSGYMLYDRVLRPAEVGVTKSIENNDVGENEKDSQA